MSSLFKTPHISFYRNRSSIVEVMTKHGVFLCLTVYVWLTLFLRCCIAVCWYVSFALLLAIAIAMIVMGKTSDLELF